MELRYFAGLSIQETAALLDIAPATVKRHWTFARAWLHPRPERMSDPDHAARAGLTAAELADLDAIFAEAARR